MNAERRLSIMEHKHKPWKEWSPWQKALAITGGIILVAGILVLAGFVVMWLWNWLMPKIFGLPVIGFWEAWGMLILSHILFGRKPIDRHMAERSRKRRLREKLSEIRGEPAPETGDAQ
jgi:hypothetical protein